MVFTAFTWLEVARGPWEYSLNPFLFSSLFHLIHLLSRGCSLWTAVWMDICSVIVEGMSSLAPATPLPSFSLTCVSEEQFLSHVLTPVLQLLCRGFYSFLNTSAQRHCQCHWWAQLWPALGLSEPALCPAQDSPASLLSRATPAAPPATQTWTPAHNAGWKLDRQSLYWPHWGSSLLKTLLTSASQMSLCCNDWHLLCTMYTLLSG